MDEPLDRTVSEQVQKLVDEWQQASRELQQRIEQTILASRISPDLQKIFDETAKLAQSVVVATTFKPPQFEFPQLDFLIPNMPVPHVLPAEFQAEMAKLEHEFARLWRHCVEGADRLGRCGWTLPVHMSPGEMLHVLQEKNEDTIDDYFIAFYHEHNEIPFLKQGLSKSHHLQPWRPLLEQCFENYERDNYIICIPALLTILEGAANLPIKSSERAKFLKDRIAYAPADSLNQVMWMTINGLVERLYKTSDFAGAPPAILNRHWVLHGRDLPKDWRKADALRLFHALSTLCSIFD